MHFAYELSIIILLIRTFFYLFHVQKSPSFELTYSDSGNTIYFSFFRTQFTHLARKLQYQNIIQRITIYWKNCWSGPLKMLIKNVNICNIVCFWKNKKTPGDIILHLCTKNLDMIYSSWDTEYGRLKLRIVGHFLPFYSAPKTPKNQNFEKMKKLLEISSFYTCVPKTTIIWGMVPEIWSEAGRSFCLLGYFLPFYPSNNPENQNFEKTKKRI